MPLPIQAQLAAARQADYLTLEQAMLLLSVSKATVRRRMVGLSAEKGEILKSKRIVRLHRLALLRLFRDFDASK